MSEEIMHCTYPSPDVLLVVLLVRGRRATRVGQLGHQLVRDLVVRGGSLRLYLLAYL